MQDLAGWAFDPRLYSKILHWPTIHHVVGFILWSYGLGALAPTGAIIWHTLDQD